MSIPNRLLDGIERLDPLPATVQKLIVALEQDEVDIKDIANTIEYDGAVASNILRMANSAIFGGRFRIEHMRDAVMRLGTTTLLDIILGSHLRTLRIAAPLYDLTEDEFWLHSAAASLAVKAIAQETRNSKLPQASTVAALVHDIGKLIMVRYLEADVMSLIKLCSDKKITFVEAEKEMFGCDHAEVGAAMARKWNFPPEITHSIEQHHNVPPDETSLMLDAVMMANLAAKSIGVGLGAAGFNMKVDLAGSRDRLKLTVEGFERVCAQTIIWLGELKSKYGYKN
jgi:putative nucleotidyltransferase with HDIG domain